MTTSSTRSSVWPKSRSTAPVSPPVLRAPGTKPAERAGKVLFINADAEFEAGRAQNHQLPSMPRRSSPPTGGSLTFPVTPPWLPARTWRPMTTTSTSAATRSTHPYRSHRMSAPTYTARSPRAEGRRRGSSFHRAWILRDQFSRGGTRPTWISATATPGSPEELRLAAYGVVAREAELHAAMDRWWDQHAALGGRPAGNEGTDDRTQNPAGEFRR